MEIAKTVNFVVVGHIDEGKCFGNGTLVRLVSGKTKEVEQLTMNDSVVGLDGKGKKLVHIHRGQRHLYTVHQACGDNYVVTGNHVLVLKFTNVEGIFWDPTRNRYKARYLQNFSIHDKCFMHSKNVEITDQTKLELYNQAFSFMQNKRTEAGYQCKGTIVKISVDDYLALPNNVK